MYTLSVDIGGTFTDVVVFDEAKGRTVVGKALTTPLDESLGFFESVTDAVSYWDATVDEVFPQLDASIYAGTTMLNTLLRRRGRKLGLLTTAGFEDQNFG